MKKQCRIILAFSFLLLNACTHQDQSGTATATGSHPSGPVQVTLEDADLYTILKASGGDKVDVAETIVQMSVEKNVDLKSLSQALDQKIKISCDDVCLIERKNL